MFLFLHVYDAHYAYDPPEPYASMFDRPPEKGDPKYRNYFHFKKKPLTPEQFEHQLAQYDESIRFVDAQLKRISEAAAAAGRSVRWVVTADHGEEFGERGSWGHAHTLYSEQLHVPLVVSGPGLPEGMVIDEVVGTHDVAPTIAGWVGTVKLHMPLPCVMRVSYSKPTSYTPASFAISCCDVDLPTVNCASFSLPSLRSMLFSTAGEERN